MDQFFSGLAILLAYLLGSVPSAYMAGRIAKGVDLRQVGSRNVGALNTWRQVGPLAAIVVLLADAAKGVLAVYLSMLAPLPSWTPYICAISVVIGHNWPVYLGFRGGRGAATVLGTSFVMLPLPTLLVLVTTVVVALMVRSVVGGMTVGFLLLNALTIATDQSSSLIALCLLLTMVVSATYLVAIRHQFLEGLRHKRWRSPLSLE